MFNKNVSIERMGNLSYMSFSTDENCSDCDYKVVKTDQIDKVVSDYFGLDEVVSIPSTIIYIEQLAGGYRIGRTHELYETLDSL